MIAEGDCVFFETEVHADLDGGGHYNNQIGFMFRFKDGKVIEHKEYTDTLHVYRVMEHEAIRGAPIPRQSNLTTVSAVVDSDYKSRPGG